MTFRLALVLSLIAAPALAQPGKTAQLAPASDDMAVFEKELDALFVSGGLTADKAASRAAGMSPSVRRKIAEVEVATAQAELAQRQVIPQFTGRLSYTRLSFLSPIVFGPTTIPFLQNAYLAETSLSIPISDYIYRIPKLLDGAKLGEDVARTSKRAAEVTAGSDAREAYYEWVRAKLGVLVAQRQLAQVRSTLKQMRALAEVQRLSRADLLRFESGEAQAEQALDQIEHAAALREEQLRLVIGARPDEQLAIGEDIRQDLPVPAATKIDELMAHAQQKRLEFRVLDVGIAAKEKQREAETASYYPKLNAFAVADYANPNPRVFPQADEYKLTWSAGVSVVMTLNDALVAETNVHRIAAETSELRADRETLYRGTRLEALAAAHAVEIAQHALGTSQKGLVAAEEGYRVRKELLAAERATAVELVDAETELTRARIAALNARVDLRVALAQLAHAVGDDVGAK
jgi:outer membrane protein TolC